MKAAGDHGGYCKGGGRESNGIHVTGKQKWVQCRDGRSDGDKGDGVGNEFERRIAGVEECPNKTHYLLGNLKDE